MSADFFSAYLFAFLFWFGIAIGALGLLMLHGLVGGEWGELINPFLRPAARTLPWLALLFVPLVFGLATLYPWANAAVAASDPLLRHQHLYLNVPFFLVRAAGYFLVWTFYAYNLTPRRSAAGLVVYMFTVSFALIDWMMSLEPAWISTIYPVMVLMGQVLAALAFAVVGLRWLAPRRQSDAVDKKPFRDVGNLLLTFVMMWAYTSFSQYLVIWSGNLPEEIAWYLPRQDGAWFWIAMALIVGQFFLPFAVLLGRRNKERLPRLAAISGFILAMNAVTLFWLIEPPLRKSGFPLRWTDPVLFVVLGAVWWHAFSVEFRKGGAA
jgi:hypothetical protein